MSPAGSSSVTLNQNASTNGAVSLRMPGALEAALRDPDNELILMRVPRHEPLRTALHGKELELDSERAGVLKSSYAFSSRVPAENEALPVVAYMGDGSNGEPALRFARPFSRIVHVEFCANLRPSLAKAPPREYPAPPKGLRVQYPQYGKPNDGPVAEAANSIALQLQASIPEVPRITETPYSIRMKEKARKRAEREMREKAVESMQLDDANAAKVGLSTTDGRDTNAQTSLAKEQTAKEVLPTPKRTAKSPKVSKKLFSTPVTSQESPDRPSKSNGNASMPAVGKISEVQSVSRKERNALEGSEIVRKGSDSNQERPKKTGVDTNATDPQPVINSTPHRSKKKGKTEAERLLNKKGGTPQRKKKKNAHEDESSVAKENTLTPSIQNDVDYVEPLLAEESSPGRSKRKEGNGVEQSFTQDLSPSRSKKKDKKKSKKTKLSDKGKQSEKKKGKKLKIKKEIEVLITTNTEPVASVGTKSKHSASADDETPGRNGKSGKLGKGAETPGVSKKHKSKKTSAEYVEEADKADGSVSKRKKKKKRKSEASEIKPVHVDSENNAELSTKKKRKRSKGEDGERSSKKKRKLKTEES